MINLLDFGYKSRAAFLRDPAPSPEVMRKMVNQDRWDVQKSVLLHPACPIDIREEFIRDPIWYKRFVAFFATKAPENFFHRAADDIHPVIAKAYKARCRMAAEIESQS